jgi:hypothetical protein
MYEPTALRRRAKQDIRHLTKQFSYLGNKLNTWLESEQTLSHVAAGISFQTRTRHKKKNKPFLNVHEKIPGCFSCPLSAWNSHIL